MSDEERPAPELQFFDVGEYDDLEASMDFVRDVLFDRTVVNVYGPSGAGKTFIVLHMVCSAALERDVFGKKTEKREALYVGLEGEPNIKVRLKAWCVKNGIQRSPISYALGAFDLADDRCVNQIIERARKKRFDVIIIDTLAMAMVGLDEISGQHVSIVLDALHRIKRETGACVIVIDHTGKNLRAGARGHSSKLGNVDTSIEIQVHNTRIVQRQGKRVELVDPIRPETPRSLVVHKQRDAEGGGGVRFRFTLTKHETDVRNARGERVASLAVDESEHFKEWPEEEDTAQMPTLTTRDSEALEILHALNRRLGRAGPASLDQLQRALKRENWGPKNPAAFRKAWERLKAKLDIDSNGAVESVTP